MGRRIVLTVFGILAAGAAIQAISSWVDAASSPSLRAWLDVAYTTLKVGVVAAFAVFVARRSEARRRTRRPTALIACGAAMLAVLLLQRPDESTATALVVAGEALALVSVGWMLISTVALGRCFGVLPEARGLVTHGPYRFVRHPLYLGEFGTCIGLVLASPAARNLFAALVFALAQAARMVMEERELSHQFPEYAAYARRTPRLIPLRRSAAA
jgi:protein-S-isoprenylcysteine O-methyltransferase Ste14